MVCGRPYFLRISGIVSLNFRKPVEQLHNTDEKTCNKENTKHSVAHNRKNLEHIIRTKGKHSLTSNHSARQLQNQTARNHGSDLPGNIHTNGMHQQEILMILG